MKNLLKKYNNIPIAAKAALWFMVCSVLQRCVSVISVPIFTRIMTTEQYGQFSVYNSWLNIFTIFATFRLNSAVFNKGMSKYKDNRDDYTSTMQSLTFMITCVLFVIYLIFHKYINALTELPTFIMVVMFVELLFMPAIDFWTIRKRYEYIYIPVIIRTLSMVVLNTVVGVIAVIFAEEKGYARILSYVLVNIVFGISIFIYNRRKATTWFNKEYAKFAILFNLPLMLHYLSIYVFDQFDKIMIQKMVGIAQVGMFNVAHNVAFILKVVTQSINNALVPWQYGQLEKKKLKELDDVLFLVYIVVSAAALAFICFAPEFMFILADSQYHEAAYIIPPTALGLIFSFMYTTFANVEFFYNQNKFTMYISMSVALLNIVSNYFGIKYFGYIAAGYTTLICYIAMAFSHYVYMSHCVKKHLGIDKVFNSKRILILSAVDLIFGILIIKFYDFVFIRLAIVAIIMIVAFVKRNLIINMFKSIRTKKD